MAERCKCGAEIEGLIDTPASAGKFWQRVGTEEVGVDNHWHEPAAAEPEAAPEGLEEESEGYQGPTYCTCRGLPPKKSCPACNPIAEPQQASAEPRLREGVEFLEGLAEHEGRICVCYECVGLITTFLRKAKLPTCAETVERLLAESKRVCSLKQSLGDCVKALGSARNIVEHFAARNPNWFDTNGVEHDPFGSHALLPYIASTLTAARKLTEGQ